MSAKKPQILSFRLQISFHSHAPTRVPASGGGWLRGLALGVALGLGPWSPGFCTNLPPATISFLDGSYLRGDIGALTSDTLRWLHPNARAPIEFSTTNLNLIRLPRRSLQLPTNANPVCRVVLASGDEFEGNLLTLDADSFEVDTWFAGRLRGQRAGLQSLAFYGSSQSALYDGPRAAEEWKIGTGTAVSRVGVNILGGFGGVVPAVVPAVQAVDAIARPVKVEVERPAGRADAPGALPPLAPAKPLGDAPERVAKNKPTAAEVSNMSSRARSSNTIADYLKSDLVLLAVESGLVKTDAIKTELDKQVKAGTLERTAIRREGALLAARLLRELEHLKNDPSAASLARTQDLFAGVRAAAPVLAVPGPVDAEEARAAADLSKKIGAATQLATGAELLKSDLLQTAVEAGVASQRAEEEWLAQQERNLEGLNENLRATQMKLTIQAEGMLLGIRLLKAKAPLAGANFVQNYEQMRERALALLAGAAEARAVGNAAADVLAQARDRAMGALQLQINNFAAPAGAEAALAGRAAIVGAAPGPAWQFRDGAYYSTGVGSLGRECHLPTKARIEFDLSWKGQPYFRFSFFTRSTEHYDYNDGWQFYTSSSGYIYSMRRSGMGATSSSGAIVPQMLAKNTVRFTFLVNTEKETVTLLADGGRVHEWKNLGSPGPGTGIVFYNYNSTSRVRLSDIRIAPWDGRERDAALPGVPGDDPDKFVEVPPADSAMVEFVNRDSATGTLHGIREGKLAFNPAGTRLEIPVARAALISFPTANAAPVMAAAEGVQVTLHRNERLTLALEKWETGEIIAVSPVFGRLKLKPESIRTLRFNPTALRGPSDEWSGP